MPIRPENLARYPPDWENISDWIRFGRAGSRCECAGECGTKHEGRCNARHAELHPRTGSTVWLTTAHLDHTPENSDNPTGVFLRDLPIENSNLRAMCQGCHLHYDRDHHAERARATREEKREQIGLW